MHRRLSLIFALLVSFVLICSGPLTAMAATEALPFITLPPDYSYGESDYSIILYDTAREDAEECVHTMIKKLVEFGYVSSNDQNKLLELKYLDDQTMVIVESCCSENNLVYDKYGVLASTYYAIVNGNIINKTAPKETEAPAEGYGMIYWGATGPGVDHVQDRLIELGYLNDYELDSSGARVYGDRTRDALDACLAAHAFGYDQSANNGITAELQSTLDSLTPIITPEPSPSVDASPTAEGPGGLRGYWMKKVSVFGLEMPNLVIWLIGLALVVLIVLAAIHFFVPSGDSEGALKGTNRKRGLTPVTFTITYGGITEKYACVIPKILRIGRNVGTFPLNPEDSNISRRHCEIYYLNNQLMLRDYSANGTMVNDRLVNNGECKLNSGDRLEIGAHIITVNY